MTEQEIKVEVQRQIALALEGRDSVVGELVDAGVKQKLQELLAQVRKDNQNDA
jgi:hypothetical protein